MINIKDCKIKMIVDSREKVFNHITSEWDKNKIEYHIFKKEDSMKVGDYSIAIKAFGFILEGLSSLKYPYIALL